MPDGQMLSISPLLFPNATVPADFRAGSQPDGKATPLSPAAYRLRNTDLLAQNARLQSALERQQTKSTDLRSILCSMDIATLCVSPNLNLRLFTAAAGRLLDLDLGQVGRSLDLRGHPDLNNMLTAGIGQVLRSGNAIEMGVTIASGQQLLCRLLPLYTFEAMDSTIDGVIVTFARANPGVPEIKVAHVAEHKAVGSPGCDDGGLAAGYPDLGCGLTERQHQVLGRVLAGQPSKNIAADLGISQRTVENHRAAIMARTGATSLPALARLAIGADVGGDCKTIAARHVCD